MKILITGNAGFIGFHVAKHLIQRGDNVVGFDSVNNYYDVNLKKSRLKELFKLNKKKNYSFIKGNLSNFKFLEKCFKKNKFDHVIHLAAQAGVRYSIINPHAYVESNLIGFTNILEACRKYKIKHLTYASTSSVYGANTLMPFAENKEVGHPLQFYAATKRSNELMAHSYSHLYNLPTTGLRFFTAYGPWGRPDMALFTFTKNIIENKPVKLFNNGNHKRDFTYIDDITKYIVEANDNVAKPNVKWNSKKPDISTSSAPFKILNIGNSKPIKITTYLKEIEKALGKKAKIKFLPLQAGDVPDTFADITKLRKKTKYKSSISVKEGISKFVDWYLKFYN